MDERCACLVAALAAICLGACSLDAAGEGGQLDGSVDVGADHTLTHGRDAGVDAGADTKKDAVVPKDHGTPDAGCAADASTDPKNCGGCGHDCIGGACMGGECQPVSLATTGIPQALAVQGTTLYWTDVMANTVYSCALPGCAPVTNSGGIGACMMPLGLAVDAAHYYFTCNGNSELYICSSPSECATTAPIAAASPSPSGITVSAAYVFYLSQTTMPPMPHTGAAVRLPLGGGAQASFQGGQTFPSGIALEGANLFWTEMAPENDVASCILAGTPPGCTPYAQIVTGQINADQIVADSANIYFTDNGMPGPMMMGWTGGAVMQSNFGGTAVTTPRPIASTRAASPWTTCTCTGSTTSARWRRRAPSARSRLAAGPSCRSRRGSSRRWGWPRTLRPCTGELRATARSGGSRSEGYFRHDQAAMASPA